MSMSNMDQLFEITDAVCGEQITDVYMMSWENGAVDAVVFEIASQWLVAGVNIDTDEIVLDLRSERAELAPEQTTVRTELTAGLVGQKIFWMWNCSNSQGYRDTVLLGIPSVVPTIILHGIGSSVRIASIDLGLD
jgi:hypothetical protein